MRFQPPVRAITAGLLTSLFAALMACPAQPDPTPAWIAPAAGQTGVPRDFELHVATGQLRVPPDYPVGQLIQVVDLESGGIVPGTATYADGILRFRPDFGWGPDRRYAWTILPPTDVPHAPEAHFEAELVGTASFDTSSALHALNGLLAGEQSACVVLSRPLTEVDAGNGALRVTVNDVDAVVTRTWQAERTEWATSYGEGNPGLDVWCFEIAGPPPPGDPEPPNEDSPPNDEDTGDTSDTDSGDTGDTSDTSDTDSGDTGDTDSGDTGDTDSGDTGDTSDTDSGDTGDSEDTGDTDSGDTGADTDSGDTGDSEDTGDTEEDTDEPEPPPPVAYTLAEGDVLRIWFGDAHWRVELESTEIDAAVARLHREVNGDR